MTNRKKAPLREIITERLNNGLDEHIRQLEVSFGDRWQDLPPLEQLQSEIRYLRVKLAGHMVATEVVWPTRRLPVKKAQQLIESAIEIAGHEQRLRKRQQSSIETKKKHLPPRSCLPYLNYFLREEGVSIGAR